MRRLTQPTEVSGLLQTGLAEQWLLYLYGLLGKRNRFAVLSSETKQAFRRSLLSTLAWQMNPRRGADRRLVTGVRTMNQGTLRGKSLFRPTSIVCLLAGLSAFATVALADGKGSKAAAKVGDAFAHSSDGGFVWTIGTKSIQMTFDGRGGVFRLVGLLNKSCDPPLEYVDVKTAAAPFALDSDSFGKKRTGGQSAAEADGQWALKAAAARQAASGGRPAVQLDVTLTRGDVLAHFHVLAFPGTSILRQWVEIENAGSRAVGLKSPAAACFQLRGDEAMSYVHSWLVGGYAAADQGKMCQKPITSPYRHSLTSTGTATFVPWTALHRSNGPKDGLFMALEYLGTWSLAVDHQAAGSLTATAGLPELKACVLQPAQRLEMPLVTFGVFHDGLDNMAASLYDWQYEYLWDYTNPDYYAPPDA